jgi:hypothetical protein
MDRLLNNSAVMTVTQKQRPVWKQCDLQTSVRLPMTSVDKVEAAPNGLSQVTIRSESLDASRIGVQLLARTVIGQVMLTTIRELMLQCSEVGTMSTCLMAAILVS